MIAPLQKNASLEDLFNKVNELVDKFNELHGDYDLHFHKCELRITSLPKVSTLRNASTE